MLLTHRWQVGAGTLFSALLCQRHAQTLSTRHFTSSHGLGAAARMVVDAVDRTRKLKGSLLQQRGKALVGMSPINQR